MCIWKVDSCTCQLRCHPIGWALLLLKILKALRTSDATENQTERSWAGGPETLGKEAADQTKSTEAAPGSTRKPLGRSAPAANPHVPRGTGGEVTRPSVKWTQTARRGSQSRSPQTAEAGVEAGLGNQVTRSWTRHRARSPRRTGPERRALALGASGENSRSGVYTSGSPALPAKATGAECTRAGPQPLPAKATGRFRDLGLQSQWLFCPMGQGGPQRPAGTCPRPCPPRKPASRAGRGFPARLRPVQQSDGLREQSRGTVWTCWTAPGTPRGGRSSPVAGMEVTGGRLGDVLAVSAWARHGTEVSWDTVLWLQFSQLQTNRLPRPALWDVRTSPYRSQSARGRPRPENWGSPGWSASKGPRGEALS